MPGLDGTWRVSHMFRGFVTSLHFAPQMHTTWRAYAGATANVHLRTPSLQRTWKVPCEPEFRMLSPKPSRPWNSTITGSDVFCHPEGR